MAGKLKAPVALYNVHRSQDGAQIITGVTLEMAQHERARLGAEARVINPETRQPTGMFMGEVVSYEVRSAAGVVI